MKVLLVLILLFHCTDSFASVDQISYQLRRMADAAEDQNRLEACLSRVKLYSDDKVMLREADCVKFIDKLAKGD